MQIPCRVNTIWRRLGLEKLRLLTVIDFRERNKFFFKYVYFCTFFFWRKSGPSTPSTYYYHESIFFSTSQNKTLVSWQHQWHAQPFLNPPGALSKKKKKSSRSLTLSTHHRHGRIRQTNVIAEPENIMKEFWMLSVNTLRGVTYNYQVRPYFIQICVLHDFIRHSQISSTLYCMKDTTLITSLFFLAGNRTFSIHLGIHFKLRWVFVDCISIAGFKFDAWFFV